MIMRLMKSLIGLCLIFIALMCYGCGVNEKREKLPIKDSIITFFDLKDYTRKEIGVCIDQVSALNPKVIGLCVVFDGLTDADSDSLLAVSIVKSGRVILEMDVDDTSLKLIRSNPIFTAGALDEGVLSIIDRDTKVIQYVPLFQNNEGQAENLASVIAFNYRITDNNRIDNKEINGVAEAKLVKEFNEFNVISKDNLDASAVSGRIVLFGGLNDRSDSLRMLTLANIILNILEPQ